MVQTAESDVIAPTVAAEDPLALLDEAVTELEELLADIAAAGLHQRDELVGNLLGLEGVLAVLVPLGEEGLDFGAAAVAGEAFLHNALHAVAHLAGGGFSLAAAKMITATVADTSSCYMFMCCCECHFLC